MTAGIYNPKGECVNTVSNIVKIKKCDDGRHLVTYNKLCETCRHEELYVYQVPTNYHVIIGLESGDEIEITRL